MADTKFGFSTPKNADEFLEFPLQKSNRREGRF